MSTMIKFDAHKFINKVDENKINNVAVQQRIMDMLALLMCTPFTKCGEIDFSSFTLEAGKLAFEVLVNYQPDDIIETIEEVEMNKRNLIVEINRIYHAIQVVSSLKAGKKQRRFF